VIRVELDELVLAAEVEKGLLRGVLGLHRGKTLSRAGHGRKRLR
jgi:hypothetical protein